MGKLKYIIAMDFNATCDSEKFEIIEFSAVLINLKTGDIEDWFREYVRPTENPKLSSYCCQLTGIGQVYVDTAFLLSKVISRFDGWLKVVLRRKSLNLARSTTGSFDCIFVTWGNDIEKYLAPECERKNLTKPSYFNQWCDLQSTFSKRYGEDSSTLRNAMTRDSFGVSFSGREHCGMDDATNIARLAYGMHQRDRLELTN